MVLAYVTPVTRLDPSITYTEINLFEPEVVKDIEHDVPEEHVVREFVTLSLATAAKTLWGKMNNEKKRILITNKYFFIQQIKKS